MRGRLIAGACSLLAGLPVCASRRLSRTAARLLWRLNPAERRAAERRARASLDLSPAEARALVRRNAGTLGGYLPDALRLETMTKDELLELVPVEGLRHLTDALAAGKGAFILSGHVGNWELLAAAIASHGIPLSVVARRPNDPLLAARLERLRARWGVRCLWREAGMLPVVRALKEGGVVGVMMDQSLDVPGTYVPFFGIPAHVATGPAEVAARLGVPVVPAHVEDTNGGYLARVEQALPPCDDPGEAARQWTRCIEEWIRRAPHTWVWMHDRWRKDRPVAAPRRRARHARSVAVAAAAVAMLCVAGCEDIPDEESAPIDLNAPSQTLAGTRVIWSQDGNTSAIIRANTLTRFGNSENVRLAGDVQVELFDEADRKVAIVTGESGTINDRQRTASVDSVITVRFLGSDEYGASTLTADSAWANDRTRQVVAVGNVSVVSDSGVTLETQRLIWDGASNRFRAPGRVRITNGTEVEEGEDMVANADLTEWTMAGITGWSTRPTDEVRARVREADEGSQ